MNVLNWLTQITAEEWATLACAIAALAAASVNAWVVAVDHAQHKEARKALTRRLQALITLNSREGGRE